MFSKITGFCQLVFFLLLAQGSWAQRDYQSYDQLTLRLKKLGSQYSKLCTVTSIGKTATGKELWLITLGRENAANKPAIVIAAGVQATQLYTTELAVQMAEQMLLSATIHDSTAQILSRRTIYILPNLNPDASEQYHEQLRWERTGNAQPRDDDRDGRIFEDPFDDLNNDGLITLIRVEDSLGTHRTSAQDPRVMVPVQYGRSEKGTHLVFTEGIDNDQDGLFNEDAEGGVNFNKNFTFDYQQFAREAGEHPMSERETKAFAEFMLASAHVHSLFVLGPATTLFHPAKTVKTSNTPSPAATVSASDDSTYAQVATVYQNFVDVSTAPTINATGGDVVQWGRSHYGRFSYSTPGWWVPQSKNVTHAFSTPQEQLEVDFLKWAETQDLAGVFLPWTPVQHPSFPGKKVEVGGLAPYALYTPSVYSLAPIAKSHLRFVSTYCQQMPQLQIVKVKVESTPQKTTLLTAIIQNSGSLPTHATAGEQLAWVRKVQAEVKLEEGQTLVKGKPVVLFPSMKGGQQVTVTWEVQGRGYVIVQVKSPTAGNQSKQIALKQ